MEEGDPQQGEEFLLCVLEFRSCGRFWRCSTNDGEPVMRFRFGKAGRVCALRRANALMILFFLTNEKGLQQLLQPF
jgi:hypothetical protein